MKSKYCQNDFMKLLKTLNQMGVGWELGEFVGSGSGSGSLTYDQVGGGSGSGRTRVGSGRNSHLPLAALVCTPNEFNTCTSVETMPNKNYLSSFSQVDIASVGVSNWKESDIRSKISQIKLHPVLSPEWLSLSSVLHQLAILAQSERASSSDLEKTLWEANKTVLRIIVEETKVHLLIKLLSSYKEFLSNPSNQGESFRELLRKQSATTNMTCRQLADFIIQFEEGAGALLEGLLHYSEVFHTISLPEFILYCSSLLADKSILVLDNQDPGRTQEALVIPYIHCLASAIERIDSMVCQSIIDCDLISRIILHLTSHKDKFSPHWYSMGLEAVSTLLVYEDFESEINELIKPWAISGLREALEFLDESDFTVKEEQLYRGIRIAARAKRLL
ncbi:hypothetical protein GEMRC1_005423 [Eukaryota sp. GEM-RC1]